MTRQRVIIIGAGGHGRAVAEIILNSPHHAITGFLDDAAKRATRIWNVPVLGPTDAIEEFHAQADCMIVAIGNNRVREMLHRRVRSAGFELLSVVHPRAVVSPTASLGPGCTVMAGAVVGTEANLGEGVIINCGAVIDHHCRVEDFGHVGTNACMAGGAVLGHGAWMQAGSALAYGVQIPAGDVLAPCQGVT